MRPPRSTRSRSARGQSVVELALGATLLVAVVMLGLYLSEVGFLSLKVQEASAAAVWDATGRPVHDYHDEASPSGLGRDFRPSLSAAASAKQRDYQDFDAVVGAGSGVKQLFAQSTGVTVSCERNDRIAFDVPASTAGTPGAVNALLRGWYQPQGGAVCTASADILSYELPKSYFDKDSGGGFFTQFQSDRRIRLCGAGRAVGTTCDAGYGVLLGDWGMDRIRRNRRSDKIVWDAKMIESPNVSPNDVNNYYRDMVKRLFVTSGQKSLYVARESPSPTPSGPAAVFARRLGATTLWLRRAGERVQAPVDERSFFMSFSGVEHGYGDMLEPDEVITDPRCRVCHFNTAGTSSVQGNPLQTYDISGGGTRQQRDEARKQNWSFLRAPCFLGLSGNGCRNPNRQY